MCPTGRRLVHTASPRNTANSSIVRSARSYKTTQATELTPLATLARITKWTTVTWQSRERHVVARHAVSVGDGSGGCWLHERNTLITTLGDEDQQPRGLAAMAASTAATEKVH